MNQNVIKDQSWTVGQNAVINTAKIAFIIPVFNEEDCLNQLFKRLGEIKLDCGIHYYFIDDGSTDKSLEILTAYAQNKAYCKIISLSRNFGHQNAITAGIDLAQGYDYLCIIDSDLQDPPELIEKMLSKAKEGFPIVYAKRRKRAGESFFKIFTASLFYRIMTLCCDTNISVNTGDFCLIHEKTAREIRKMREKHRFIRGMIPWTGFPVATINFDRDARFDGQTKFSFGKMLKFAMDALFSFSAWPAKFPQKISAILIFPQLISFVSWIFTDKSKDITKGSTANKKRRNGFDLPINMAVLLGLGICLEYQRRIYEELKGRPLYIIKEKINC